MPSPPTTSFETESASTTNVSMSERTKRNPSIAPGVNTLATSLTTAPTRSTHAEHALERTSPPNAMPTTPPNVPTAEPTTTPAGAANAQSSFDDGNCLMTNSRRTKCHISLPTLPGHTPSFLPNLAPQLDLDPQPLQTHPAPQNSTAPFANLP
jgi:hypothetical protein